MVSEIQELENNINAVIQGTKSLSIRVDRSEASLANFARREQALCELYDGSSRALRAS